MSDHQHGSSSSDAVEEAIIHVKVPPPKLRKRGTRRPKLQLPNQPPPSWVCPHGLAEKTHDPCCSQGIQHTTGIMVLLNQLGTVTIERNGWQSAFQNMQNDMASMREQIQIQNEELRLQNEELRHQGGRIDHLEDTFRGFGSEIGPLVERARIHGAQPGEGYLTLSQFAGRFYDYVVKQFPPEQ